MEWAHHVEERCVSEEGSGPVYAPMDVGFGIYGCGSGDADDGLHDDIKRCKKLGQLIQRQVQQIQLARGEQQS
jgi:hypothetical protein